MTKRDDAYIIQKVIDGDTEAFARLVDRHGDKIYGLVIRLLADEAEAEEVTQETFVQAFTHLADFRGQASFATWLYHIAYNISLQYLRRHKNIFLPIDERLADSVGDDTADAALNEATEERIALVEAALQHLSPDDRTLVTLYYYEERPTRDIAYVLDTTITNVTTRLHRARKRLYLIIKQLQYDTEQ